MFRSGLLTQRRVEQIVKRAEATPHNLRIVAKACAILPQDLLAWFAAGQDPACTSPQMRELAWRINCLRADAAARNYARIEAAATGGKKTKTVTKPRMIDAGTPAADDGLPSTYDEVTVEDVLPAAWAITKIEELAAASHWEIAPDAEQAEELHRMMRELAPTPLLTSGGDDGAQLVPAASLGPVPGMPGRLATDDAGEGPALDIGGERGGGLCSVSAAEHEGQIVSAAELPNVLHTQTLTDPE